MELLPIGPVVIIDTPGFDDEGALGELRIRKTRQILNKSDVAVLVADCTEGLKDCDRELIEIFRQKEIPWLLVWNKCDLRPEHPEAKENEIYVSATEKIEIEALKEKIAAIGKTEENKLMLVGDLMHPGDMAVLVIPIDKAAPKGRLILPQQQVIRDILEAEGAAVCVKEYELRETLEKFKEPPAIVITDSQVFAKVLMWPLLALGGVTIFIFVERFMAIRKASVLDMNFMNRIRDYISDGKISTAVNLCKKTDTPIARMIEKGIERIGRPMSDVQTAIENVANLEVSKLENGLPFLATIAGGAPMIGFLGTVLGMVQTFMDMSAAGGTVDLGLLSSGMYVAMVTTVMGLIVGIPAYFGYNYLVARIEKLVFQMEANSIAFMDILNQPVQK